MEFIIVDKDQRTNIITKKIIRKISFHFPESINICTYNQYTPELELKIQNKNSKIYIIAINLEGKVKGIDIAKRIREFDLKSVIFFLTTHSEMFNKVHQDIPMVYRFISKDQKFAIKLFKDLQNVINKIYDNKKFIYHSLHTDLTLFYKSITYINRDKKERKLIIHTDQNDYKVSMTFKEIGPYLDERFKMSHRACLVNTERIESYDWQHKMLYFDSGITIPYLSKKYRSNLEQHI